VTQRIYIYSPSSAVRNKAAVRRGAARLKAMGHEVELDPAVFATHMRFAGDDETRLAAIERAARSGADVAIITRGGYGLTRLLPKIPYKLVAKAIDRGTRFVGLSDFTAFQGAVLAETGRITWSGPAVGEDFGVESEPDDIMQACFEDLVTGQGEGSGWQLPKAETPEQPLQVKGTLWGGNLAMITALVGTPWMPGVKGGILFLEDVSEHPYRIERMLTQLLYAGVLQQQKAIVLGHFTNWLPVPHDKGF
jgi:muramoyltetrapeptide carboxypeptidase